jgi:hypothetical protein
MLNNTPLVKNRMTCHSILVKEEITHACKNILRRFTREEDGFNPEPAAQGAHLRG